MSTYVPPPQTIGEYLAEAEKLLGKEPAAGERIVDVQTREVQAFRWLLKAQLLILKQQLARSPVEPGLCFAKLETSFSGGWLVCELQAGHDGAHQSGGCHWTDGLAP